MTEQKARELVKNRLGGDIINCDEDQEGKSYQITVKPGKYLITESLSPDGDIRIWQVDFERKEVTVIVSDPGFVI
ncbi:MAG: hypothetical protein II652_00430 [Bacteroidales bacterium]|nr:hypothetical protein [Bacteroidales bacterium]